MDPSHPPLNNLMIIKSCQFLCYKLLTDEFIYISSSLSSTCDSYLPAQFFLSIIVDLFYGHFNLKGVYLIGVTCNSL